MDEVSFMKDELDIQSFLIRQYPLCLDGEQVQVVKSVGCLHLGVGKYYDRERVEARAEVPTTTGEGKEKG